METNKVLQAQEAMDVSVLLKNVSDDLAFQMVVNLFTETHKEIRELQEYFDYIWTEYGNGVRWEYLAEKHNDSQTKLSDLEETLGNLLAAQAKDWKGITQLIGNTQIDIKYLLYEMPSDLGIDFINNYLEHIADVLYHFELEKGSPKDDDERKSVVKSLDDLQAKLIAIRNEEVNSEKEFQRLIEKLQEAEAKERQEMIDELNKRQTIIHHSESEEVTVASIAS